MYVTSVDKTEEHEMKVRGALGVKVKYLLHKGVGAEKLQLRLFTIDFGGHTPIEDMSTNMKFLYCVEKLSSVEERPNPLLPRVT